MLSTEGMGPYPLTDHSNLLTDHSNLLGPSSIVGITTCRMNYGTNTNSNAYISTNANTNITYTNNTNNNSPMPPRRCLVPARDSFRRHSAHGRIICSGR